MNNVTDNVMDNAAIHMAHSEMMYALSTLKKWGNSQAIRIPRNILDYIDLNENDKVKLSVCEKTIIIEKVEKRRYQNLQERLEAFYDRPLDGIYVESGQEVDMGAPVGNEQW